MQDDIKYMVLGDTYADIMYARELIIENQGDTAPAEAELNVYQAQLEELEATVDEADPDDLLREATQLAQYIEDIIITLTTA